MKRNKGIIALTLIAVFISGYVGGVKADEEIERITKMLKNMSTASTEEKKYSDAMSGVWEIEYLAKYSPYDTKSLADAYIRLKVSKLEHGFKSLVWANANYGGGSEALHRTAVIIQEMVSNGRVSLSDLSGLDELIPNSSHIMSRALGLFDVAELKDKVSRGIVRGHPAALLMLESMLIDFSGFASDSIKAKDGLH